MATDMLVSAVDSDNQKPDLFDVLVWDIVKAKLQEPKFLYGTPSSLMSGPLFWSDFLMGVWPSFPDGFAAVFLA